MKHWTSFAVFSALALQAVPALAVGAFDLPWMNHPNRDAIYHSGDHPNSVFVLEAFENFCGSCNANAVNVDEMAAFYADEPRVQVLDLALDSDVSEIQAWIARHQPNHPVVRDVDYVIWNEIGESYIPTVAVVDCRGDITYKYVGEWEMTVKAEIKAAVADALASSCSS